MLGDASTCSRISCEGGAEQARRSSSGTTTSYPWGNIKTVEKDRANCLGCTAEPLKKAVATGFYPPSAFGLFDMVGNAAGWVEDCWNDSYRGAPSLDETAMSSARDSGRVLQPRRALRHFTPSPPCISLRGMVVAHAGSDKRNSGHDHLLIDTELSPLDQEIPSDFNHLHFGAGETEAEVDLSPGEHTLQLLFGDKRHIPHSPPLISKRIKVRVVEPGAVGRR